MENQTILVVQRKIKAGKIQLLSTCLLSTRYVSSTVPSTRNSDVNTIKVLPSGTNLLAEERDHEHSYYRMSV